MASSFQKQNYNDLSPNFDIHHVSDLYIPMVGLPILLYSLFQKHNYNNLYPSFHTHVSVRFLFNSVY
jgi:hypothetical protein